MTGHSDLRIVIVGGGVCGITCAAALAKKGLNAHIYEAKSKFGEIGAGIGIGASALKIMEEIGVYDDILACTPVPGECNIKGFRYVLGSEGHEEILRMPARPDEYGVAIHRAAFLDALVKHLDPAYTHFNKRCIDVTPADPLSCPILTFDDGTTVEADVVLLANGVKCPTRKVVTGSDTNAVWSTNVCYRGLVTREETTKRGIDTSYWDAPSLATGNKKLAVIYPINKGALINIAAFVAKNHYRIGHPDALRDSSASTLEVVSNEELLSEFEDFGSNIRSILGCITKPNKWYINVVYPHLESYVNGRVALLGDAAHAMLPHMYAGAGQGIEDGYLLAQLLGHPQTTSGNIKEVLEAYDAIRRPRSQKVWDYSIAAGKLLSGNSPRELSKETLAEQLIGAFNYVNSYKVGEDIAQAEDMLKEKGIWV